jgi:hypothetical protein
VGRPDLVLVFCKGQRWLGAVDWRCDKDEAESLILAQNERWRRA